RSLLAHLQHDPAAPSSAVARLSAACELGGIDGASTSAPTPAARELIARFLADQLRSRPLGFYTWTEELRRVFRQDRFLPAEPRGCGTPGACLARRPRRPEHLRGLARPGRPSHNPDRRPRPPRASRRRRNPSGFSPAVAFVREPSDRTALRRPAHPRGLRPRG